MSLFVRVSFSYQPVQPGLTWNLDEGLLRSGWSVGMTMKDFSSKWEFPPSVPELGTELYEWKKVS